jgi:hypothetical protein
MKKHSKKSDANALPTLAKSRSNAGNLLILDEASLKNVIGGVLVLQRTHSDKRVA